MNIYVCFLRKYGEDYKDTYIASCADLKTAKEMCEDFVKEVLHIDTRGSWFDDCDVRFSYSLPGHRDMSVYIRKEKLY